MECECNNGLPIRHAKHELGSGAAIDLSSSLSTTTFFFLGITVVNLFACKQAHHICRTKKKKIPSTLIHSIVRFHFFYLLLFVFFVVMVIGFFDRASRSMRRGMGFAWALFICSAIVINHLMPPEAVERAIAVWGAPGGPDRSFGLSAAQFYGYLEQYGESGRGWYLVHCAVDVFPFMESYTLLLVLLCACSLRWFQLWGKVWLRYWMLLSPFVGCCFDMSETLIGAYITYHYTDGAHKHATLVPWHAFFVRAKWLTLMPPLFFALAGLAFRPLMLIFSTVADKPKQH